MKSLIKIFLVVFLTLGFYSVRFPLSFAEQNRKIDDLTALNGEQPTADINETVRRITSLFPKAEGKILSIEDNIVRINLGKKNGITTQIRLTVFREGKEFFHPVTKVVMGRYEIPLSLLEIKEVGEETSLGVILDKKESIKIEDKVRITSGRIRLAFLFREGTDRDAVSAFYESLEGSGRFNILDDEKVRAVIGKDILSSIQDKKIEAKDEIKKLGKALEVEGIIFLDARPNPKGSLLKANLIHTFDGKSLGTYEVLIPVSQKQEFEFPLPVRRDYWRSFDFDYKARLMGIGDLDGDGKKEIVISDGTRIRIYRIEDYNLSEIWSDKERTKDNHINIDIADINRNGKPEIYVTNHDDYLNSFVIEYRDGEYRRIWDKVPLFFRVMNIPGKGETLIAQDLDDNIHEYSSKEDRYVKGNPLKLPPGIEIYGFAFVDWGKNGYYQLLYIDEDDYLNLYTLDGIKLWRSKDRYGGYVLSFERTHWTVEKKIEKVKVKGRIIVRDYPEENRQKAVIIKNIPLTYFFVEFKGYREAEVACLNWNGSDMVSEWRIGKIEGFIADYGVGDLTNTGKDNLFLLMNPTIVGGKFILKQGLFDTLSGKSRLLLYHFPKG